MFRYPEYYKKFRHEIECDLNVSALAHISSLKSDRTCQSVHLSTYNGDPMSEGGKEYFKQIMLRKLAPKPWIADYRECGAAIYALILIKVCLQ